VHCSFNKPNQRVYIQEDAVTFSCRMSFSASIGQGERRSDLATILSSVSLYRQTDARFSSARPVTLLKLKAYTTLSSTQHPNHHN
jgi:hypothetical protein